MSSTVVQRLEQLIQRGDSILHTTQPHMRQMLSKTWRDDVGNFLEDIPEASGVGLTLAEHSLAADVGLLARYRHLLKESAQLDEAGDDLESMEITREITQQVLAEDLYQGDEVPGDDKLRIFISRKKQDEQTVRGVKAALERYGAGRIRIYVDDEIEGGKRWIDWITESLGKADLFMLVFTDDSQNWDFCLYEAGLFTNLHNVQEKPVICVHNPKITPPEPLRHLQAVKAEAKGIQDFLKDLFTKPEKYGGGAPFTPLNPALADQPEELERAAKEIEQLISRQTVSQKMLCNHLTVQLQSADQSVVPPEARVRGNDGALAIFGLQQGNWTWGDVERQAKQHEDQRWLQELAIAISSADAGKVIRQLQATVISERNGRVYRPILSRVDTLADRSKEFTILFIDEVSWNLEEIPNTVATVVTSLTTAVRFRYEILLPFFSALSAVDPNFDLAERYKLFLSRVEAVEMEAASRGYMDELTLMSAFAAADRRRVGEMFSDWYKIRFELFDDNSLEDRTALKKMVSELLVMNEEFLELSSSRLTALLQAFD